MWEKKEIKQNKFSIKEKKTGLWFPRKDWTIVADQTIYNWWVIHNFRARTNLFYILYEVINLKTAGVCMATRQMQDKPISKSCWKLNALTLSFKLWSKVQSNLMGKKYQLLYQIPKWSKINYNTTKGFK